LWRLRDRDSAGGARRDAQRPRFAVAHRRRTAARRFHVHPRIQL